MNEAAERERAWSTWLDRWTWISLPGALLAVPLWGLPNVAGAVLCLLVLFGTLKTSHEMHKPDRGGRAARSLVGAVVGDTWRLTLLVVAVCAVSSVSFPGLGLAVGCLVVTSPPLAGVRRRRRINRRPSMEHPVDAVGETPALLTLIPLTSARSASTHDLCSAWRRSDLALAQGAGPAEVNYIAMLREGYLAELERRDLVDLERWSSACDGLWLRDPDADDA